MCVCVCVRACTLIDTYTMYMHVCHNGVHTPLTSVAVGSNSC